MIFLFVTHYRYLRIRTTRFSPAQSMYQASSIISTRKHLLQRQRTIDENQSSPLCRTSAWTSSLVCLIFAQYSKGPEQSLAKIEFVTSDDPLSIIPPVFFAASLTYAVEEENWRYARVYTGSKAGDRAGRAMHYV